MIGYNGNFIDHNPLDTRYNPRIDGMFFKNWTTRDTCKDDMQAC